MSSSPFTRYQLANGLEVLLQPDPRVPLISSMMVYHVGSRDEPAGLTGASHFIEHMLFKGSRRFGKGMIDQLSLSCGGSNNAYTFLDSTAYALNLPASHWQLILEIEADRMQHALFEPAEIEAERQVILEEWQSAEDDPDERLWEMLLGTAIRQHPYRQPVLGWVDDLRQLSREKLLQHYQRFYTPNQASLILVGDLPGDALAQIESHFGQIPIGQNPSRQLPAEAWAQSPQRLELKRKDVTIPRLVMAWPAPAFGTEAYYALLLLHYLLSEGWSSRLHQELLESQQRVSDISTLLFETRDPFLFWLQADVNPDQSPVEVERAIEDELDKVRQGQISAAELERARNQLLTDLYLKQETTEDRAGFAAEIIAAGSWQDLAAYTEKIQAVTLAQVQAQAQHIFSQQQTTGWLLPARRKAGVRA